MTTKVTPEFIKKLKPRKPTFEELMDLSSIDESSDESKAVGVFSSPPPEILPIPNPKGYLLVTLNYPRTILFSNKSCEAQRAVYQRIWQRVNQLERYGNSVNEIVFEHCQNGMVHMHGIISVDYPKFNIAGVVSDFARIIHAALPKKYENFLPNAYNVQFERYKVPSMVIQYKSYGDDYLDVWHKYMSKDIENNFLN